MNILILFTLGLSLTATLSSYQRMSDSEIYIQQVTQDETFPYPAIPSVITSPAERASYLLTHYWEKVDFNRHTLSSQDALLEQGFVDFLSVFPHAENSVLKEAFRNMLKHALVDASRAETLIKLVENYLYHPNSPMLNEEYYRLFLEECLQVKGLSLADREKMRFHLSAVNKNRVGTIAANFAFADMQNQVMQLHEVQAQSTLLFFYDADCEECKYVLSQMEESAALKKIIESGRVKVVTVCIEGTDQQWKSITRTFPDSWMKGRIEDTSVLVSQYVLRAMPTIYLLDQHKKVVLKDVLLEDLLNFWNKP